LQGIPFRPFGFKAKSQSKKNHCKSSKIIYICVKFLSQFFGGVSKESKFKYCVSLLTKCEYISHYKYQKISANFHSVLFQILEKSSRADHKSENMKYFVVLFLVVCYLHLNSVECVPAPGDDAHPVCAKEAETVSTFFLYTLLANNERKLDEILLNSCIKVA
jgi:hypothetical protein